MNKYYKVMAFIIAAILMTSCSTNSTTQYSQIGSTDESMNSDLIVEEVSEEYKIELLNSVGNTLNKN